MFLNKLVHTSILKKALRNLSFLLIIIAVLSCSSDEENLSETQGTQTEINKNPNRLFKGIFVTQNSKFRCILELIIPGETSNLEDISKYSESKITLNTGEIYKLKPAQAKQLTKNADFKVFFESDDLSFNFILDVINSA